VRRPHSFSAWKPFCAPTTKLRAAVRLAGKKIVQLYFGRRNNTVLEFLRTTLREARAVAREHDKARRDA